MDLTLYQHDTTATAPATMPPVTEAQLRLLNWAVGLGEVGELQNLIKKHVFHGHTLVRGDVVDEMGDVLWYIAQLCTDLGVDMSEVARYNTAKLRARYPEGFSSERSINR